MFNCAEALRQFHDDSILLPEEKRKTLRDCRSANQKRLKEGLKAAKEPSPVRFVKQGSYAMKTTIQQPNNDYDIDDGALFVKKDLKDSQGADKTALDARNMVCAALQDKAFKKKPEVRENCVRVYYNEGHHVDIPVYRIVDPDAKDTVYELASADWKQSNPEGVTKWFEECVKRHNGQDDDSSQLRRMVRYLKAFAISRPSWNMPSGFILTVLANELYRSTAKDDEALYNLFAALKVRLAASLVVRHPVLPENITKTAQDPNMVEFREKVSWALDQLKVLLNASCSEKEALKAWATVFNTDFFQGVLDKQANNRAPYTITGSTPTRPVEKQGGGRFG